MVSELNSDLGGLSFYEDATGKYVVGADSVPKKLGKGKLYIITGRRNNYDALSSTFTIDISLIPGYTDMTTDDMVFALSGGSTFANGETISFSASITSYNAATGIVTVKTGISGNPGGNGINYILGVLGYVG